MPVKIRTFLLTGIITAIFYHVTFAEPIIATSRNGRINENVSYEALDVKRGSYRSSRHGLVYSCSFTGKILSTSHDEGRNLTIRFTGLNNFKEELWKTSVTIQSLPPFGAHEFSEKITCRERDPFYWKIEFFEGQPLEE